MAWERSIEHWASLPFLSVREAAAVLGVGDRKVRELLKGNVLQARTVCGKTMVLVESIRDLAGMETPADSPAPAEPLSAAEHRTVQELRGRVG